RSMPAAGRSFWTVLQVDYRSTLSRIASFALVLGAWEYAGRVPISAAFPSMSETAVAGWLMIRDGSLIAALAVTVVPMVIGVVLSAVIGVMVGIATGLSRRTEWVGIPLFLVLQAAPLAALVPMLVLAYGVGVATKVLV